MSSTMVVRLFGLQDVPVPQLMEPLLASSDRYQPLAPYGGWTSTRHYGVYDTDRFCRRIDWNRHGMLYSDRASPVDLLARVAPYLVLGSSDQDPGGAVVYCPSREAGPLVIHPAPSDTLSRLVRHWLTEPVPPVYLLALRGSPMNNETLRIPSVLWEGPGVLGEVCLTGSLRCVASVRVGETCRLDWLWNHERFLTPLNQLAPHSPIAYNYTGWLFLDPARPLLCLSRHVSSEQKRGQPAFYQQADLAAIVSTLIGYTSLDSADLAFLMSSYWLTAALEVAPAMRPSACRTTSALLLTDILARAHSLPFNLFEMLTVWKDWSRWNEAHVDWIDYQGYRLPRVAGARKHPLGGLPTLLKTLRLALTQFGIAVPSAPGYQQYLHLIEQLEALRC